MHSIKVQNVCDADCKCQQRYGEQIIEEGELFGEFHKDWEDFIGSVAFIHQLKILKQEDDYVPSRWRMKEDDM